ncbi:MAG: inositol monophosphatase [Patescibacteria group bacterium]
MDHIKEFEFAKDLALQAGKIMLKYFYEDIDVEMKENVTPLTIADTTINKLVIDSVRAKFPEHAIIGEEGNGGAEKAKYEWIVDPIDGTIPYTIKFPTSMFSLALYYNKKPVFGILYDPYTKKMYHAIEGGEAYCNDKIISVKKGQFEKGDIVGLIHVLGIKNIETNHFHLTEILNRRQIRTEEIHCLVYFAAAVASGYMKCALVPGAYLWDRAASLIILKAAGAKVTDEKGRPVDAYDNPKNLVISNGDVHDEIISLLKA